MKKIKRVFFYTFSILTLCILSSCGGGGGGDEPSPPPPPPVSDNNWDSLVWDQGEWQ